MSAAPTKPGETQQRDEVDRPERLRTTIALRARYRHRSSFRQTTRQHTYPAADDRREQQDHPTWKIYHSVTCFCSPSIMRWEAMDSMPLEFVPGTGAPDDAAEAALGMLITAGTCDAIAVDRARSVARETGIGCPQALVQLGLVSERASGGNLGRTCSALMPRPKLATRRRRPAGPAAPEFSACRPRGLPVAIEPGATGRTASSSPWPIRSIAFTPSRRRTCHRARRARRDRRADRA